MASCVVFARMLLAYSVKNDLCFGVGIDADKYVCGFLGLGSWD